MNDMLISRRAEIEAEAKFRGVHPEALAAQVERIIARVQSRALGMHQPSESYVVTEQSKTRRQPQKDYIPKALEITPLAA